MNASPSHSATDDAGGPSSRSLDDDHSPRWRRCWLRLNPLGATAAAAIGLVLIFGLDDHWFGLRSKSPHSLDPADAVDISLRQIVRPRVVDRLQREHRLNGSLIEHQAELDYEIARIREHPLYLMIQQQMTEHLRAMGYKLVPIRRNLDARNFMLSVEAETVLHDYTHSMRVFFRSPNEKVAAYLREHEERFGKSIANHDASGNYQVALPFMICVLFEYPDDLSSVVETVRFVPLSAGEIEANFQGQAREPTKDRAAK